jgi:hypothetical protein
VAHPDNGHLYVLALGSNRGSRHARTPKAMLATALGQWAAW